MYGNEVLLFIERLTETYALFVRTVRRNRPARGAKKELACISGLPALQRQCVGRDHLGKIFRYFQRDSGPTRVTATRGERVIYRLIAFSA